jgi:Fur family ferric uptake transcriptional regulator
MGALKGSNGHHLAAPSVKSHVQGWWSGRRSDVMTNRIEARCRAKGLRLTGPRKLIAQVIAEAHDHPDVPELHRRVAEHDDGVSLATVYRAVKRFEELGIIERHAFQDGRARYELAAKRHHDHLIDIGTGKVIEFRSEEIERLQAEIADQLGYELVGHRLELYARRVERGIADGTPHDRRTERGHSAATIAGRRTRTG